MKPSHPSSLSEHCCCLYFRFSSIFLYYYMKLSFAISALLNQHTHTLLNTSHMRVIRTKNTYFIAYFWALFLYVIFLEDPWLKKGEIFMWQIVCLTKHTQITLKKMRNNLKKLLLMMSFCGNKKIFYFVKTI